MERRSWSGGRGEREENSIQWKKLRCMVHMYQLPTMNVTITYCKHVLIKRSVFVLICLKHIIRIKETMGFISIEDNWEFVDNDLQTESFLVLPISEKDNVPVRWGLQCSLSSVRFLQLKLKLSGIYFLSRLTLFIFSFKATSFHKWKINFM